MTDDKRQRRAEAVERLREYHDWEPAQKSLANLTLPLWPMSANMSNDQRIDSLIDLLTDEDTDAPEADADAPIADNVRECPETDAVEQIREIVAQMESPTTKRVYDSSGCYIDGKRVDRWLAEIADMVERDYVRRDDYNDLALLRAEAERERDEWKRKAQSKDAPVLSDVSSEVRSGSSDNGVERSNDGVTAEYLGTVEPETSQVPECDALSETREHSLTSESWQESGCESDTRDAIDADAEELCDHFYTTERRYDALMELLDRQAAITRREHMEQCPGEYYREERDRAITERDRYREMCGKMLDAAQEIQRIGGVG